MIEQFNLPAGLIIAFIMSIAPQMFDGQNLKKEEVAKLYQQAQERALYIVQTGDAQELEKMEAVANKLMQYERQLHTIGAHLAKSGIKIDALTNTLAE